MRNMIVVGMGLALAWPLAGQTGSLKSVELADLDLKVQPCDDFYDFANGSWRASHPIPASMDRWSRRWKAGEDNKEQLRVILDDVTAQPAAAKGSTAQLTGDFYRSCTNTKVIDEAGIQPLRPLLAQIDAIRDRAGVQAELRELHGIGVAVPFYFGSVQDNHDPSQVIAGVYSAGLGLPDRDYYVKPEKRFVDARSAYVAYVAKLLTLGGGAPADAANQAARVMVVETALAKATLDNVQRRDPHATDHLMTFDELSRSMPHFDWAAFYGAAKVKPGRVNVEHPEFLAEVDRQLAQTSIADWKTYLRWQLLNSFADDLSDAFVQARFDFYQRQLAGVGELKPRGMRCAEATDGALGEALGEEYVKRYFPPAAKERAKMMVGNILAGMHDSIESADWMTVETKQRAFEKLGTFNVKIGYPDKWKDYSSVKITPADYLGNSLAAARFQVADDAGLIGKPVDRSLWGMTPPTSNAYYNPSMNEIVFPAGILQPPAFNLNNTDALNYGAIGVVIGHEISHGFDDQGAQFDAQGKLTNWWTPVDLDHFHTRTGCVSKQFDGYTIDGGGDIHINGKLTLGESIGDLGGLKIAYLAFKKTPQGQSTVKIDGYTPDQQFFIAWGQFRGDATRPETQKMMVQGDPHPVAKYRVLGPMSNFPPFASAFSCKAGSAMVRPEAERCTVW